MANNRIMVTFAKLFTDLCHDDGDRILYSFVSVLIGLSNLAAVGKIQKNV